MSDLSNEVPEKPQEPTSADYDPDEDQDTGPTNTAPQGERPMDAGSETGA